MSTPALVVMPIEQLREVIEELLAADRALRATERAASLLVGCAELARLLGISKVSVHRLRVGGMPAVRVGDVHRYEPAAVMAYLRARGQP